MSVFLQICMGTGPLGCARTMDYGYDICLDKVRNSSDFLRNFTAHCPRILPKPIPLCSGECFSFEKNYWCFSKSQHSGYRQPFHSTIPRENSIVDEPSLATMIPLSGRVVPNQTDPSSLAFRTNFLQLYVATWPSAHPRKKAHEVTLAEGPPSKCKTHVQRLRTIAWRLYKARTNSLHHGQLFAKSLCRRTRRPPRRSPPSPRIRDEKSH